MLNLLALALIFAAFTKKVHGCEISYPDCPPSQKCCSGGYCAIDCYFGGGGGGGYTSSYGSDTPSPSQEQVINQAIVTCSTGGCTQHCNVNSGNSDCNSGESCCTLFATNMLAIVAQEEQIQLYQAANGFLCSPSSYNGQQATTNTVVYCAPLSNSPSIQQSIPSEMQQQNQAGINQGPQQQMSEINNQQQAQNPEFLQEQTVIPKPNQQQSVAPNSNQQTSNQSPTSTTTLPLAGVQQQQTCLSYSYILYYFDAQNVTQTSFQSMSTMKDYYNSIQEYKLLIRNDGQITAFYTQDASNSNTYDLFGAAYVDGYIKSNWIKRSDKKVTIVNAKTPTDFSYISYNSTNEALAVYALQQNITEALFNTNSVLILYNGDLQLQTTLTGIYIYQQIKSKLAQNITTQL